MKINIITYNNLYGLTGDVNVLKYLLKNENIGFFYRDDIWFMVINEKERMNDNDKKIFNEAKPKLLAINEKKNLNFEDKDSYYGFGWSHNLGKPGLWSEGPISTLLFRTDNTYGDLKLEISCQPYITKKNNILELDIYVNNSLNKNVKLTNNNQDETFEILIKEKLIENNEIKIVAIDKWNNKSEKTVKVTVKLKATDVVKFYEELKPNKVKVSKDKNKIAIIIGVEKYKNMTECNYCNRDAKAFREYATRALGVIPSNIISLVDSKATRGEILRAFKISLPRIAGDGGKDINIFFAGHGLASESGEDLYIIPQDGDQGLLEDTAISRVELIKLIKKVNPKSVTMFFDTCYSGQTRGEQMLVASLRGIRIVDVDNIPDNLFYLHQ